MNYFINYHPNVGLSISTYRQAGYSYGDIGDLATAIVRKEHACCQLDNAKKILEDCDYWKGTDVSISVIEELHNFIPNFEYGDDGCQYENFDDYPPF